jgi:hypothetical protein
MVHFYCFCIADVLYLRYIGGGDMEKYFAGDGGERPVAIVYDSRMNKRLLSVGGYAKDRELVERV